MQLKKIIELPKQIYDKIAAGEVVDRPVSIVKELVENSIDAGATSITVEIKNGGKTYIRITDNGSGIIREEADLAFKRHATSKIRSEEDLNQISTLGFRGEALASICSVSKTELITKTKDDKTGLKMVVEGGEFIEKSEIGHVDGTSVMVNNLFYNTPARLKFLKSDNVESRLIIEFVSKMALAYSGVRFRMINNGSSLFSTPGKGDALQSIHTVYSSDIGKNLICYKSSDDSMDKFGMSVEAYISPPNISKTNRKNQVFFVNGRVVSSKTIEKAVSDAYREKMFDGRYPVVFLFFTILSSELDVNIHPNKKEVRFEDDKYVRDFIASELRRALLTQEALPQFNAGQRKTNTNDMSDAERGFSENVGKIINNESSDNELNQNNSDISEKNYKESGQMNVRESVSDEYLMAKNENIRTKDDHLKTKDVQLSIYNTDVLNAGKEDKKGEKDKSGDDLDEQELRELLREKRRSINASEPEAERNIFGWKKAQYVNHKFDILQIEPIGTVFATYIVARDSDNMYLIDQHAAHERIFYEELLEKYFSSDKLTQAIIIPEIIEIPHSLKGSDDDWLEFINAAGFDMEEFGMSSYAIKGIPEHMTISEATRFVKDFIDNIDNKTDFKDQKKIEKIISNACKSAVKANYNMSNAEIKSLLKDLSKTSNPFSCPHGRPTIIRVTKHEMEKMFKRV